jgi:predicted 3-demethylubiquinone-9 3-methyltransferase (glyoxalase superfamily)
MKFTLRIAPCLWFDSEGEEAARFYTSIFFCETQKEIDYYWDKLSAGGDKSAQQCGWLKDKYGVSWQVVPAELPDLVGDGQSERSQRVMMALFQMKKLDIAELKRAHGK